MSDTVEIYAKIIMDTEKAWRLDIGEDELIWIRKSLVESFDPDEGTVIVQRWWAEQNKVAIVE